MFMSSPYVLGVLVVFGAVYFVADMGCWAKSLLLWRELTLEKSAQLWHTGTWPQKLWALVLLFGCTLSLWWVWFIRLGLVLLAGVCVLFVWGVIRH